MSFIDVSGSSHTFINRFPDQSEQFSLYNPSFHKYVPRRVNDSPIVVANFVGRLRELDFLSQLCVKSEEDVPIRCAVHGMPGVGKTELLLQFARIAFSQLLYSHIFWLSAATPDELNGGMTKILDIVGHPERIRSDRNAKLTAARLWLEDPQWPDNVRWLLILDNVDGNSLNFLHEHLPRRSVSGNILFTTRSADVADALVSVYGGFHSTLELRVPDLLDATKLLFTSARIDNASTLTPTQINQTEQLVQNLGSLPLAVVQATSYMRRTDMNLDAMIQISNSERKIEMIGWENVLMRGQERSVVAAFNTLLDPLQWWFPETYAILEVLSFLDPECISLTVLTDGARILHEPSPRDPQRELSTISRIKGTSNLRSRLSLSDPSNPIHSLVSTILSPAMFPGALHRLQSLSLVGRMESSLCMNNLVHFVVQERVKRRPAYPEWLGSAVSLVCGALECVEDPDLPQSWPEYEKFMPHVRSLSKAWTGVQGVNLDLVTADVCLARYLNNRGRYDDAERLCERSVKSLREVLGYTHSDTLEASNVLALVYYNQGRLTEAEEAYKNNLAVRKELGVDDDSEYTLATMNDLAWVYHRQGRHMEAEELYKQVLHAREKKLGPIHPDTLTTMDNLAAVFSSQRLYDKAEELFKRVLGHREELLGPNHVDTLTTVNNLAYVYRLQTKYIEAEALFKRALVGLENQLGPSHPRTLTVVAHLARLYQSQARYDEAEQFFLRASTEMKQQLGANHPDTLQCADDFAAFYRSQGRDSEADALLDPNQARNYEVERPSPPGLERPMKVSSEAPQPPTLAALDGEEEIFNDAQIDGDMKITRIAQIVVCHCRTVYRLEVHYILDDGSTMIRTHGSPTIPRDELVYDAIRLTDPEHVAEVHGLASPALIWQLKFIVANKSTKERREYGPFGDDVDLGLWPGLYGFRVKGNIIAFGGSCDATMLTGLSCITDGDPPEIELDVVDDDDDDVEDDQDDDVVRDDKDDDVERSMQQ